MNTFINYLVEANLSLCFFLAMYGLILNNETDFRFKRIFLLLSIVASLLIPLIHLGTSSDIPSLSGLLPASWLPEFTVFYNGNVQTSEAPIDNTWNYIYLIYGTGVAFFLVMFGIQIVRLLRLIHRTPKYALGKFSVAESEDQAGTFSFFNYIFIGHAGRLSENEKQQIIHHEGVHASRYHSIDILLVNLLIVFCWFNPLIRIYRKIIVQVHEFEADARAVRGHDVNEYCSLLARVALHSAQFRFANHFTNSLTLKRIIMIRKDKAKINSWKLVGMTAMITVFFYFIASQEQVIAQVTPTPQGEVSPSDEVYMVVEQPASYYKDGMEGLGSFIAQNLRYPKEARQKGLEGTVFVSFIVEKNGTLTDAQIQKGVEKSLDDEAIRVVKLTKWIPGKQSGKIVRTRFVMPIKYKLG
jgi:TonB family protein